jgi:drug/metabolite transporter (DMT)-like permease
MPNFFWLLLFLGITLSSLGGIFLKMGSVRIDFAQNLTTTILNLFSNWPLILGIFFYFIPTIIWIYLLQKIEISYLQPLFALAYVLTPLLAYFILHESISPSRWVGIFIIISGVFLFARG